MRRLGGCDAFFPSPCFEESADPSFHCCFAHGKKFVCGFFAVLPHTVSLQDSYIFGDHRTQKFPANPIRSEEHTSELQSISYAVFCLKKNKYRGKHEGYTQTHEARTRVPANRLAGKH